MSPLSLAIRALNGPLSNLAIGRAAKCDSWEPIGLTVFPGGANGSGNGAGNGAGNSAPAVPVVYSECRAWGDPHVITFDGANNDVYGVATYILAQSDQEFNAYNNATQVYSLKRCINL